MQGNYVGLSEAELSDPSNAGVISARAAEARAGLRKAGAHFVNDSVNELPAVVEEINRRMDMGIRP